jgi:hypothetical protein
MGRAPIHPDVVDAVVKTLLPLVDEGNASVLQDWGYICKRDFERLHKDGYLVEVCEGADAERAERRSPEITMSVPRACFTDDEVREMERRGYV